MANEPLNTEIKGNPEECRAVARWLDEMSRGVHQAGDALFRARSESESLWQGQAGDAFRDSIGPKAKDSDEISNRCSKLSTALMNFAGTLEVAQRRMAEAREVAAQAGIDVTPTQIDPPDVAPVVPNRDESTPQARGQYFAAHNAQRAQLDGFREASDLVDEARERESDAHRELGDVLRRKSTFEAYGPTGLSTVLSTGSAMHGELQSLEEKAGTYLSQIKDEQSGMTREMTFTERQKAATRITALRQGLYDTEQSIRRLRVASEGLLGPWAHRSPADAIETTSEKVTAAGRLGKAFPYAGTVLTAYTAGRNIYEGKPAAKEVEKAGAGILASVGTGAAAGACIGGPVGAVVGAVGGAAVSYGVGKFIDWKGGPVEQVNRSIGIE